MKAICELCNLSESYGPLVSRSLVTCNRNVGYLLVMISVVATIFGWFDIRPVLAFLVRTFGLLAGARFLVSLCASKGANDIIKESEGSLTLHRKT